MLTEHEPEAFSAKPGDHDVGFVEARGHQEGVVSAFLKGNGDVALVQGDRGGGLDEVAEQMPRFGRLVTMPDLRGQESIKAAGHEG
jgi:hypothetical protein